MVVKQDQSSQNNAFSRDAERQAKREALLAEAARLFNRHGIHGTRLEDIAEAVGLTKTGVSYYFSSKEELAAGCYARSCETIEHALSDAMAASEGAARIVGFFRNYAREWVDAASGKRAPMVSISEVSALNSKARDEIGRRLSQSLGRFVELAAEAIDDGTLPARRPEPVAYLMMALVNSFETVLCRLHQSEFDHFVDSVCDILENGLFALRPWTPAPAGIPAPNMTLPDIFDRETRNALKREAFLKTGAVLFNQRGFKGVSLNAIAKELGVTRGAFYHHIPDKEDLLARCFDRTLTIIEDTQERAQSSSGSGGEIIEKTLRSLTQTQISGVFTLLRPNLLSALPSDKRRPLDTRLKGITGRFGDYIQQGIADGSVREVNADIIEHLLTSAAFMQSGIFVAASENGRSWKLSENPVSASIDYARLLFEGAKGRA